MLPYSRGLILDNTNNYGIVKTEAVFGFGPSSHDNYVDGSFNATKPLEWIITSGNFAPRSMQDGESRSLKSDRSIKSASKETETSKANKKSPGNKKRKSKGKKGGGGGGGGGGGERKCVLKVIRKTKNKNRRGNRFQKKYMMPMILGLLAAKSLLIPIALKALAFLSAKGLMMGFFSTVMASVLSLKGMFDHNHGSQNRKDDTKTQVEIIQVPSKTEDHVYYDEHYRRGDYIPVILS